VDVSMLHDDTVICLRSLQGLIGREMGGAVYLDNGKDADNFWRSYCTAEYGVLFKRLTAEELLEKYADVIGDVVIYTPDSYEFYIAQNIASVSGGIIASPDVYERYKKYLSKSAPNNICGRWNSKQEAYDYSVRELLPKCSKNYISMLSPSEGFNDYAFAVQSFSCELSLSVDWEKALLADILSDERWQLPAVCFAESDNDTDWIDFASGYGFTTLAAGGFSNATFFSSVRVDIRTVSSGTADISSDGSAYVSVCLSADSMGDVQQSGFEVWSNKRSVTHFAMEFYPSLFELAPPITNWYLQNTMPSDTLIAASGWGCVNDSRIPYDLYEIWHLTNNYFLSSCGITCVSADRLTAEYSERNTRQTSDSDADGSLPLLSESYDTAVDVSSAPQEQNSYDKYSDVSGVVVRSSNPDGALRMYGKIPIVSGPQIGTAEELSGWLNGLELSTSEKRYYSVFIPIRQFDEELYIGVDAVVNNIMIERPKTFNFPLISNVIASVSE
jgi:hypothetical protein